MRIPLDSGAASAKASDRTFIAVALVVCAAVVAMGAFALLAAERVDSATRARWGSLVAHTLERKTADLQRELRTFAHWDESVLRTAYYLDADWVHRNFGQWLYQSEHHSRSYVLIDDAVAYASIDGEFSSTPDPPFDRAALMPYVEAVRGAVAIRSGDASHEREGLGVPTFRSGFTRVEGRPAIVGAVNITPDYGRVMPPDHTPPVALSVMFLDAPFLKRISDELRLDQPRVSDTPPQKGWQGVSVPFDGNTKPAWLVWLPDNPGTALLEALLPALAAVTLLLLSGAAVVLWHARSATRSLAESEAYASRLAYLDPLCGLANRTMLMRVLGERLKLVTPQNRLAVFFLDLDGFKDINDTLGHHVGDLLLSDMSDRLKVLPVAGLMASRFGGDEFVLLAPVSEEPGAVAGIGALILEAVRKPISVGGHALTISGSIGATVAPTDSMDASELIRLADIAVYRAKAEGRGILRQFEPGMEQDVRRRRDIATDLQRALRDNEMTMFYQPQFAADGRTVVGFEALIRWIHPSRGLVSPGEFIPIAEQSDLITELDMWALRRACQEARDWAPATLAVNLSPIDFRMKDLVGTIARILAETGFPAQRLEIEITENVLLGSQPEAYAALSELRDMGVRIALDDFGSGYSSLGYLRRFRVDTVKIDRSFVQNIGLTDDAAAIIDCVVRLARAMAITVTAEGVETRDQLRYLKSVGCHQIQGYLLATSVPAPGIERYLGHLQRMPERDGMGVVI